MRARWLFALTPLLMSCGGGYVAQNTPDAPRVCEREADNDPKVAELKMKMAAQQYWRGNYQDQLIVYRQEALQRCMREKGLLPPGGVEVIKPVWYPPLF